MSESEPTRPTRPTSIVSRFGPVVTARFEWSDGPPIGILAESPELVARIEDAIRRAGDRDGDRDGVRS